MQGSGQLLYFFLIFAPILVISILYIIPMILLVRTKGYTSATWIVLCIIPIINLFAIHFIVGMPDKIARNYLLELKKN